MSNLDWMVLIATLAGIILYGSYKGRGARNIEGYLMADRQLPWYHIGLSVMATQASAITFISLPGQAYTSGLGFIQIYYGLPLATILLCITFVPAFRNLKVFTAYEFLQQRFDGRTRLFTAFLFLLQRGLSTGITIYAPALILSTILSIPIVPTIVITGMVVIAYTVYGGTKAVSYTQLLQMTIIFAGLITVGCMVMYLLPPDIKLTDVLHIAGKMGKLNAIDTSFNLHSRYTLWSGLIGGFFLQLSYLGTDQSQVGRYLTAKSIKESRMGLIFNGIVKIPMQLLIMLCGLLVFAFYQFNTTPVYFNQQTIRAIEKGPSGNHYHQLEEAYNKLNQEKQQKTRDYINALHQLKGTEVTTQTALTQAQREEKLARATQEMLVTSSKAQAIRAQVVQLVKTADPTSDGNDSNYVFLNFVTHYLPRGVVGLIIAIIFLAAMGSSAGGLNALASTTVIDFYKNLRNPNESEGHYLNASRWSTVAWGIFCTSIALYAGRVGNLIEAVNVLGSFFYGTILGIFLVAFYLKKVQGRAVFYAALLAELIVIIAWYFDVASYLWLNTIGCVLVLIFSWVLQKIISLSLPQQLTSH